MAPAATATRLNREDQQVLNRLISLHQTGGVSESAAIDKDYLLADGNFDLFYLNYFPNDFQTFEKLNYDFINFLEHKSRGMAWLPGGHGKTTTLLHYMCYVMCREPQISFIYCEKSEPAASARAKALMDILEFNPKLTKDFGEFKSRWWSADAIVIKQRPIVSQWPTVAFYGAQSKAVLGSRCNIMFVDDPVTADNSSSELERVRLRDWFTQAAATCPYPLPLKNEQYLRKLFLIGTTFHMDDLYHTFLKGIKEDEHLWLPAVDMKTGETLSPRFTYRTEEELKRDSEDSEADAQLLHRVQQGKVISLGDYRKTYGTKAFMRRYQNEVRDDSTAKFPELWFRGGTDDWAPPGGYPGCLEDNDHWPGRSYTEKPAADGFTYVTGVDPAAGTKGQYTVRFSCCTLACDLVKDPNTVYVVDLDFGQQPMVSDNPAKQSQVDIILQHAKDYGSRIVLEDNNVQGVWYQAIKQEAGRRGQYISLSKTWTGKQKKVDPEAGIEAMQPLIENGSLRLPYKFPSDRKKSDELIEEFIFLGAYPTDDILMSFWLAWRVLERLKRSKRLAAPPKRVIPAYRNIGDRYSFGPNWTPERIHAFLNGTEAPDGDDDD